MATLLSTTINGTLSLNTSTDQMITLNATDNSWAYLGFSWSGSRRGYFGLNSSGELEIGSDLSQAVRIVGTTTLTIGGNTAWHSGNLTNLNQLTNGPGYLTSLGFSYSTGVNANHVVQRDANAYIYANYINFNTGVENPSIANVFTDNGDGWIRKSSLAHVKNSIRGVADGTWGINISGSASQLGGYSLQNVISYHSSSDFADGTLVVTDINAAVTYGDSFVMEVTGKTYGSGAGPFALLLEGYIYADTYINVGAISYGGYFPGPVKILNYGGNLAFWWPRGSYWNSFSVRVRDAGGSSSNRVTSIVNSTEPASSKKVSITPVQSLHSSNYNSYSPTLTGTGASGTWGINITGNAATASGVAWSNVSSKPGNWLNTTNLIDDVEPSATAQVSGFYQRYQGAGNPTGTWFNYINVRHSNPANGHGFQIGMSYYDSNLWFRSYQGGTSPTFASWSRALGTQTDPYPSNMNQYVRTTDTVSFGKLDVNFSGSAVNGIGATHTGSISSGQTAQAFSAGWSAYGASFLIAYKQGELSPSDMCHIYNIGGFYMKIYDGSTNRFHRWDDNGSVSINSSSQGSYIFNVTGDIYATADVIAFSDARVKEDVRTVENALDKVTKLRGVTYIKKDEENKKRKMGVIAQEVLEVLPEVVHEDNDGYYGVSYGNIVGVLIEAIKEQQKQIDELKQELKNK